MLVPRFLLLGTLPWVGWAEDACDKKEREDSAFIQTHVRTPPSLCSELSDGRLDYLAGGPYSAKEVGEVACNMAANVLSSGTVLASPSNGTEAIHTYPNGTSILQNDYYYMWQRDAGLTMRTLLRVGGKGPAVKQQAATYAEMMHRIWQQPSPNVCAPWGDKPYVSQWCSMMGEVKFFPNRSVYDKGWGRPQNDGPAINALVMMDILTKLNPDPSLAEIAKSVAIAGLTYAGDHSQDSTIDPWEMLYGQHFFVQAIQERAFAAGVELAQKGAWENTANFGNWANMMPHLLEVHWIEATGAMRETVGRPWFDPVGPKCLASGGLGESDEAPCELDVAVLLGALYGEATPGLGSKPQTMPPHDSRILSTAHLLVESMGATYEVNRVDDEADLPGVLIGRYPGDEYSGVIMSEGAAQPCQGFNCANPWFLTTHTLADILFKAAAAAAHKKLVPDSLNTKFLRAALDWGERFSKRSSDRELPNTAEGLAEMLVKAGDGVLERAKHHALPGLHMSEQIYRGDNKYPPLKPGIQFGVRDLTWSYASLLDALASRVEAMDAMAHL